ncbi:hypothetical protein TGAM01_v200383 [Trichoderma gamsii]|uniref:Uncharacterized protein n=1 Tax=Trichoderma gamsii TaxID=398673 RepID=A0A2P5A343_9HYPO|nr:hypothetical protein TGAM01_v200383 [Trichoderma gamsii]PON30963.1 hypothetical protein TGAM01_v200383 [Trichoderma gamsii]
MARYEWQRLTKPQQPEKPEIPFTDHVQPTIAEPRPLPTQAEPVTAAVETAPVLLDEGTQTGPIATISEDQLQKRVDELIEKRFMALVEEHGILLREDEYVVRREKGDEME